MLALSHPSAVPALQTPAHKMMLHGRSVYHNVESIVKHFAHFARDTSVLLSSPKIFHLPERAMPLLNFQTFTLMKFCGFLLKPCFGALWKSVFSSFFFLLTSTL